MTLNVYAIYDVKSDEFFHQLVLASKHGQALRMFADLANDKEQMVGAHPEDFKLVCIGAFDPERGQLASVDHQSLGFAGDYVRKAGE